jgi:hypothetical protein
MDLLRRIERLTAMDDPWADDMDHRPGPPEGV